MTLYPEAEEAFKATQVSDKWVWADLYLLARTALCLAAGVTQVYGGDHLYFFSDEANFYVKSQT